MNGKRYHHKDTEQDIHSYPHPRRKPLPKWDKDKPGQKIVYYTDGSKIESKVRAAYIKTVNGKIIRQEKRRLADDSSVFQAEVWAIKRALEDMQQHNEKADICVDSQAALSAICNSYHTKVYVKTVQDLIWKNKNQVSFHWTKAHVVMKAMRLQT